MNTLVPALSKNAVLFDALQIPAGILQFHRIPLESTGIELESTGIHRNGTRFQWIPADSGGIGAFLQEWNWNFRFFELL
jgi:hypothetical protein